MSITHRAPASCPVCSDDLITLRVGCASCGTEISGHFTRCRFCALDRADLRVLEVFLRSRGNVRDVQAHLGVSYPTARQRIAELLDRLGLADAVAAERLTTPPPGPAAPAVDRGRVLADLAAGRITVDVAESLLGQGAAT